MLGLVVVLVGVLGALEVKGVDWRGGAKSQEVGASERASRHTRAALGATTVLLASEVEPEELMRLSGGASAANKAFGFLRSEPKRVQTHKREAGETRRRLTREKTLIGSARVPMRDESRGLRSKTSTPSRAPRT